MTSLHTLRAPLRSRHRKKRVGRGQGSGLGKTAGRGGKGQKARTGNMHFEGFEGGQSPLQRRLPKFGFRAPNRLNFAIVNVEQLADFPVGSVVDPTALRSRGLISGRYDAVKILGRGGALKSKITVRAHKFSESAKTAIAAAGGQVVELPLVAHPPEEKASSK